MAVATLGQLVASGGARLLDLLMPPACVACKAPTARAHGWCAECYAALPAIEAPACRQCAIPLPPGAGGADICLGCLAEPPAFQAAAAPFRYTGPARETVLRFKTGREELAGLMARQMLAVHAPTPGCLVVPVPLHRWRLLWRGYNQAALLAAAVAQQAGLEAAPDALRRTRATRISRGLRRKARKRNVAGAFAANPAFLDRLDGRHVILVDDVMTTGATASACARALRRAGAAHVTVLIFARVAGDTSVTYKPAVN